MIGGPLNMRKIIKKSVLGLIIGSALVLGGCSGNVGVGLNVGVPIGNHGYMSLGTNRWY